MGTCNFTRGNARRVYAVLMDYEDFVLDEDGNETEETEMRSCEDWDIDDLIYYIEEKFAEHKGKYSYSHNGEFDNIGTLSIDKMFGDCSVEINLTALMHSGYYEGASLDWKMVIYVDGSTTDVDSVEYDFKYCNSDMNGGMLKIQGSNAQKWVNKVSEEMIEIAEKVFTEVSMPLKVVATFSTGETIYEKCD